jgi:hypothetical protein
MKAASRLLVFSSIISPSPSNASSAFETIRRPPNQGAAPSVRRTGSHGGIRSSGVQEFRSSVSVFP